MKIEIELQDFKGEEIIKRIVDVVSKNITQELKEKIQIDSIFSVREVSKIISTTERTIMNHINQGLLKATKQGKRFIITQENLNNYINGVD